MEAFEDYLVSFGLVGLFSFINYSSLAFLDCNGNYILLCILCPLFLCHEDVYVFASLKFYCCFVEMGFEVSGDGKMLGLLRVNPRHKRSKR